MFKRILGPIAALMGAAAILLSMPLPPHSAGRGLFDLQTILFLVPFGLYVTCALLCILFRWECSPFLVTLGILFGEIGRAHV